MYRILLLIATLLGCNPASSAAPVLAPMSSPTGPVEMQLVWDLHQHPPAGTVQPQLRQGVEADTDDWPATFYFTFQGARGLEVCTASLVGPQVLLTAAHCVPPTHSLPFQLAGTHYTANCTVDEEFRIDVSADWALCDVGAVVPVNSGKYETIEPIPVSALQGKNLVLGGFGCTSNQVSQGQVSEHPIYMIGMNAVAETSLTAPGPRQSYDPQFYGPTQKYNLIMQPWGANTCPGDSGGPAFRITQTSSKPYIHRMIDAVNSRVFYADSTRTTWGPSLLSATGDKAFSDWAKAWANEPTKMQKPALAICGLTAGPVKTCRQ